MNFTPSVLSVSENSSFSWLGHVLMPGLFDGKHCFSITKNEKGCLLVQEEKFRGLLAPLLWNSMKDNTREGFEQMNAALKQRAEAARDY